MGACLTKGIHRANILWRITTVTSAFSGTLLRHYYCLATTVSSVLPCTSPPFLKRLNLHILSFSKYSTNLGSNAKSRLIYYSNSYNTNVPDVYVLRGYQAINSRSLLNCKKCHYTNIYSVVSWHSIPPLSSF